MIQQKLLAVQQALRAPKNQFNSFGKYNYRSCEDILEAVKPLLQMNQLILCISDDVKEIGGRVYVQALASLFDVETGEAISTTAFAREEETKKGMDASQVTGAASSYARKYALSGLLAIDDNKDSDATNKGDKAPESSDTQKPSKDTPLAQKAQQVASISDRVAAMVEHDDEGYFVECAECDTKIRDMKKKDGSLYSVQDYVAACLRVYDRPLCRTCIKKNDKGQAT